ncbi:MAG: hypothetical protein JST31_15080 [Actinobacteria bacterium]|nr:hypothetical protein [Actinomycetota bacterium]
MSRIRSLALLATVAALAVLVSACGGGGSSGGSSEDPQKVIDQATLKGIESGNLNLALKVKSEGEQAGSFDVSLSGPFQAGAKGELPEADLEASVHGEAEGEKVDFEGGVTLLSDRAYIGYGGEEFEVDPTTFGFVKSGFEQAEQESAGEGAEGKACQEAAAALEPADFVENLKNEGGVDVEGTQTTEVSGDLNVSGAIDQIVKLTKNPACSSSLEAAGPLPLGELEKAKDELASQVKKAHASVYVGEEDNIVRKITAELTIEPEGSKGAVELEFELSLGGVNEKQTISAPANAKPLEELFQKVGINPLELLEGGSSGGLGGLLEGIEGGTSSGGGESPAGGGGAKVEESQAYLECLQEVKSAADLQKCANLAPK